MAGLSIRFGAGIKYILLGVIALKTYFLTLFSMIMLIKFTESERNLTEYRLFPVLIVDEVRT